MTPEEKITKLEYQNSILIGLNEILDMSLNESPGYTLAMARVSSFVRSGKEFSEWVKEYKKDKNNGEHERG